MIDAYTAFVLYIIMIASGFGLLRLNRWRRYLVAVQYDTVLTETDDQMREKKAEILALYQRLYPWSRSTADLTEAEWVDLHNNPEIKKLTQEFIRLAVHRGVQDFALWYTS